MNSNEIEIFLLVYERRSISKVAKDLYFSKQNISKILKSLESMLRVELFKRDNNGVTPTAECDELYNVLMYLKSNLGNIGDFYMLKKNPYSVRIADNNFESIMKYFNMAIEKYSDDSVLYSYENQDAQEIYNMLLNKKCEIGIFAVPKELEKKVIKECELKNINLELLLETGPSIVVSEIHPLAKLESVTPKDLKDFKRIDLIRTNERKWYFNKYLNCNDISTEADMKTNSISNITASLEILDYYFISIYSKKDMEYLSGLRMLPLKETGLEIVMFLGYNTEANFDKVAECFMELVKKHYKGDKVES